MDIHANDPTHEERYTTTTPSTVKRNVEEVEGHGQKPEFVWRMENGLDRNFQRLGELLASHCPHLYCHPDGGLVLIEHDRPRRITTAKELAPFLIDTVRIHIEKNGKYHAERPSDSTLSSMLRSRSFLDSFRQVEAVVTTPIVLDDYLPSQPGFNAGGIFYLGPPVPSRKGLEAISTFLDVMEWQSNADRTNVVAALLTVAFRHHFPGGKPLVLITATKSHAGKGTIAEFIRGSTTKAEVLYENVDWPMHRSLHEQLQQYSDAGVISIDNVRIDSAGRGKMIRSAFLESFITNNEVVLSSTRSTSLRVANHFVVLLNTNEGSLSIDLLNRSLPIRLSPTGDLVDRVARAKARLGGDIKLEWLPTHRSQIEEELWGMIAKWNEAGRPLDESVRHPMGAWAKVIGGILEVNGFSDFLSNYSGTRCAADPLREAISILAFHAGTEPRRAHELAQMVVQQGLAKALLPHVDAANPAATERAIGVVLTPYVGESFAINTPEERITYQLKKQQGRFGGLHPHFRYTFAEVSREPRAEGGPGIVLEVPSKDQD